MTVLLGFVCQFAPADPLLPFSASETLDESARWKQVLVRSKVSFPDFPDFPDFPGPRLDRPMEKHLVFGPSYDHGCTSWHHIRNAQMLIDYLLKGHPLIRLEIQQIGWVGRTLRNRVRVH